MKLLPKLLSSPLSTVGLIVLTLTMPLSINAGEYKTDAQRYSACKVKVMQQFDNVKRVKARNMKTRQGVFHAKIKVTSSNGAEPSLVNCKIDRDDNVAVSCLNEPCSSQIAAVQSR